MVSLLRILAHDHPHLVEAALKFALSLAVLVAVFSLSGCGGSDDDVTDQDAQSQCESTATVAEQRPHRPADPAPCTTR